MLKLLADILSIFINARPEGWVVIGFVIFLLVLAVRQVLSLRGHFHAERKGLAACQDDLRRRRAAGDLIDQSVIDQWLGMTPREGLVHRVIAAVWAHRQSASPDLEAISSMLERSEAARLSPLRGAPNRFLLAGLLGTVMGLAGVVGTLGPQIQGALSSTDPRLLTQNLGITLLHMQDAFACTAWGILCAILVAFLTSKVASEQSNLLAEVQQFGLRDLSPLVFPQSKEAQLDDMRRVLLMSQQFLESVAGIMTNAASRFETVLTTAGEAMATSVTRLETVATGMEKSLTNVAGDVRESAVRLDESSKALHKYHDDLRSAYITLLDLFKQSRNQLEEQAAEQLRRLAELQEQFGTSANKIVLRIDGVAVGLRESTAAFVTAGDRFYTSSAELQLQQANGFREITETLSGYLKAHQGQMVLVEAGLRNINASLTDLTQRLDPRLLPADQWNAVRDALVTCAQQLQRLHSERELLQNLFQRLEQIAVQMQQSAPYVRSEATYPSTPSQSGVATDVSSLVAVLREQNSLPTLGQIASRVEQLQRALDKGLPVRVVENRDKFWWKRNH